MYACFSFARVAACDMVGVTLAGGSPSARHESARKTALTADFKNLYIVMIRFGEAIRDRSGIRGRPVLVLNRTSVSIRPVECRHELKSNLELLRARNAEMLLWRRPFGERLSYRINGEDIPARR